MTNDEMLKLFEGGYPQRASFIDYLTPDPNRAKIIAADRALNQFRGSETPESKTVLDYFGRDPIAPLLNRGVDPARVMPDTKVAPPADRVSMPNLSGLTDYLPSMNTLSGLVPREIPNVFGVNNPLYAGLLGEPQSQALSKQSNIAGLLGAAAALVQGMGRQGGRRSAAQNIISALGAGYGSAGQQYQQGLQMYGQTQQLALQQRQQAAIQAMKLKYPEYADELDANPAGAFRLIAEREAAGKKLITAKPGEVIFDPTGKQIAQVPADVKSTDKTANIKDYEYYLSTIPAGQKPLTFKEFGDSVNKAPSVTTNVYSGDFSKGTKGKIEENVLSSAEAVGRLNNIWGTYKPEYLKVPFRLKQEWSGLASKFKDIPETDKKILSGYSTFKQNSLENLNQTIKALTGAAMGVQEADRIIASLPNAGTTVFGGDSPDEFEAKLVNAVEKTKYALARQTYALKLGINKDAWEKIKLDDMPSIVLQRENELGKKYYGDKFNKNDIAQRTTIKRQLAAEFGIPF
jgi:hypothetical protein